MPFTNVDWLGLISFFAVGFAPALANGVGAKAPSVYSRLKKLFRIPTWGFTIIWVLLYAMLSVGAFLFWQTEKSDPPSRYHAGLAVFVVHQVLNALWAPMLFGQGWLAAALAILLLCFFVAIAMCGLFFVGSAAAGALILPLLLWYLFAAVINIDLIWRNGAKVDVPEREYDKLVD